MTQRPISSHPTLLDHTRCVFINCPFDAEYEPNIQAIVLGCVACGFTPRCASDIGEVSRQRLDRILEALCACHWSIHDLSRCRGEGDQSLARFNMPLELGFALARRHITPEAHRDILILVPSAHQYVRYVSDLAGIDPREHDGTPRLVLRCVMAWLARHAEHPPAKPPDIDPLLPHFAEAWAKSREDWGLTQWWHMVERARSMIAELVTV